MIIKGKCYICGSNCGFEIEENATLLREAKCIHCNASIRNSDVAHMIVKYIGGGDKDLNHALDLIKNKRILNTCSSGHIHNVLKKLDNYVCSEYFDDIPSGQEKDGVLCVDLCNIPFDNNYFDLIISEDVFEHIKLVNEAFLEINRVLKNTGIHIFTVPIHEGRKTVSRENNAKKVYHGDPIRNQGTLVYTDFGDDIVEYIEKIAGKTKMWKLHTFYSPDQITDCDKSYDEYLSHKNKMDYYFKYNSNVVVTHKKNNELAEFTGERFVPGIDDSKLTIEHMQRYKSILPLVKGKSVLDIACGEGYGTEIIATEASSVIGMDIDKGAINRASTKYHKDNLEYRLGNIADINLLDKSIDVIVSFETIEHVNQELQNSFLREAKRILKENGLLIISTPNKEIYSDRYHYFNEFHVKEFYYDEFVGFLKTQFKYIKMYNQSFEVASIFTDCEGGKKSAFINENSGYSKDGKYYIAIASNEKINVAQLSSVFLESRGEYQNQIQRVLELQNEEEKRNQHIQHLNNVIEKNDEIIVELQKEEEKRNQHIHKLDQFISEKDELIEKLQIEKDCCEKIKKMMEEYAVNRLEQETLKIDEVEQEKEKIRIESEQRFEEYEVEKQDLIQQLRNKEGHIALLLESERELERYKNTSTYRHMLRKNKIVDWFLPPQSKRLFILRVMKNILTHPRKMMRVIHPSYIGNYIKYLKSDSIEAITHRYDEILSVANGTDGITQVQIEQNVESANGSENVGVKNIADYEVLYFCNEKNPMVSIIIPVYNQFDYTYKCLKSILQHTTGVTYEILIADDCSTDLTKNIKQIAKNVELITTEQNVRFLLNCNNAAKYARGKYIFFLNNDTQVQENWLAPLVELIERSNNIGMVGSMLIYPDGRLQEAGGIVWKDASAWNYGHLKNPDDPEFNYVKEVDYISGAAIMIRKDLWNEIGGFDERFAPAYYEDTDLAFEVRKRGYKVMYQPLSRVVHFEGVSNGTDVSTGLKHYQQVNYEKFYDKWKEVLEAEHEVNAENVFTAKDRSNHKKHMLVVDHYVPHHDQDAGGRCTYMYLQLFVRMGFKVTFIGDNFFKHEPYTTELNQIGIEVLYGNYYYNNWQDWLKENSHYFDYIYLQRPHISVKYIDIVKKYSNAKILYFAHDLHHIREYREYEITGDKEHLKSSEEWKKIEYDLFSKADVGHVVGSYEQAIMQKTFPDKPIRNIPLYIYENLLTDINKNFEERKDLMYVGGFGHHPNVDAVLWFAKEVFPKVIAKYPDIKWHVIGGKAPDEITNLASDNIVIDGFVSDEELAKFYRSCRMDIVPLRYGAGVKGKVVEAGYFQIPLVTTSIGAEGLSMEEQSMLVEDDADKMAQLICDTYEDYNKLRELSDNSMLFIKNHFMLSEAERVIRLDVEI